MRISSRIRNWKINHWVLYSLTISVLNISQHRDLCFDTIECGNNALTLLMGFTEGQAVLHPGVVWDPDIWDSLGVLDGNHFTDLCAISSYMQEMRCR